MWSRFFNCEKLRVLAEVASKEATVNTTNSDKYSHRIRKYGGITICTLICGYASWKWYKRTYGKEKKVNVLCAKEKGDYKDAFETFIETKLNCTVNWINTPTDLKEREKYLLLCKLNTRAPEDVECEFQTLRIEIKGSEKHIMIVIMQMSESGKEDSAFNCLGTSEHSLHKYVSTRVLYRGSEPYWCYRNEKAKEDIEKYLSCKNI